MIMKRITPLLILVITITLLVLTSLAGVGVWRLTRTSADIVAPRTNASEDKAQAFVCGSIKVADLRHAKLSEFSGALAKSEEQAAEGVAKSRWVLFLPEGLHIPASASPDTVYDLTGSECLDLDAKR